MSVHDRHCDQQEYKEMCKYNDSKCPVVLRAKKYHTELRELCRDPHIFSMVSDLLALGETYNTIQKAQNFGVLNRRYKALSGRDCLRLGSVKEAILKIYPKEPMEEQ